jgi:hypothetical protein
MWPNVTQLETRQIELEAELRLYGEREALAQARLAAARAGRPGPRRRFRLPFAGERNVIPGACRA